MTVKEVQALIDNKVPEGQDLEYKAAAALANKDEITKDVTAFANASGGRIIYGVVCFQDKLRKLFPEKIDPIDPKTHSQEYLDQVINNIQQRIVGHKIHAIEVTTGQYVYVVDIPQSDTCHQAADKRYYRRYNFECLSMYDYEIRDVMNRAKQPKVHLEMLISDDGSQSTFVPQLTNTGKVIALHWHCSILIPLHFLDSSALGSSVPNTIRKGIFDYIEVTTDSTHFGPVHPGRTVSLNAKRQWLKDITRAAMLDFNPLPFESSPIEWTVYADSAEPMGDKINLRDVWRNQASK